MLFMKNHQAGGADKRRLFAMYEIAYTAVDFVAALCFVVGSIMFFSEAWLKPGTWLFLIGSICFALKPTIRLIREIRLARMGEDVELAERLKGEG